MFRDKSSTNGRGHLCLMMSSQKGRHTCSERSAKFGNTNDHQSPKFDRADYKSGPARSVTSTNEMLAQAQLKRVLNYHNICTMVVPSQVSIASCPSIIRDFSQLMHFNTTCHVVPYPGHKIYFTRVQI